MHQTSVMQSVWEIISAIVKSNEIMVVSLHFRERLFDKNGECASIAITDDTHDAPLVTKNIVFSMFYTSGPTERCRLGKYYNGGSCL